MMQRSFANNRSACCEHYTDISWAACVGGEFVHLGAVVAGSAPRRQPPCALLACQHGHCVFPASLADEGLAAAVESMAEEAPVRIVALPAPRLSQAVETAAYLSSREPCPTTGP